MKNADFFGNNKQEVKGDLPESLSGTAKAEAEVIYVDYSDPAEISLLFEERVDGRYEFSEWQKRAKSYDTGLAVLQYEKKLDNNRSIKVLEEYYGAEFKEHWDEEDGDYRKDSQPESIKTRTKVYLDNNGDLLALSRNYGGLYSKEVEIYPSNMPVSELTEIIGKQSTWVKLALTVVRNTKNVISADCWITEDEEGTKISCFAQDNLCIHPLESGTQVTVWGYFTQDKEGRNSISVENWKLV